LRRLILPLAGGSVQFACALFEVGGGAGAFVPNTAYPWVKWLNIRRVRGLLR